MKHLCHSFILLASALGLLLVGALWVRSYYVNDYVLLQRHGNTHLGSDSGVFSLARDDFYEPWNAPPAQRSVSISSPVLHIAWERGLPQLRQTHILFAFGLERSDSRWENRLVVHRDVSVPYWAICLALALPLFVRARAIIRVKTARRRGACAVCGYDLRAGHERCPECGTLTDDVCRPALSKHKSGTRNNLFMRWRAAWLVSAMAVLCLVIIWKVADEKARNAGGPIERIIQETCVDSSGHVDRNISNGYWRWSSFDEDLNGDQTPERIIVFYAWQRWGGTPEQTAKAFDEASRKDGYYIANAILILSCAGGQWRPIGYCISDEGISVSVVPSAEKGLKYLLTNEERGAGCSAWGAVARGGEIGPLSGILTKYGKSRSIERFAVRYAYPK